MLTSNEKEILEQFFNMLDDHLSNCGCNDFSLKNTPENRDLVSEAIKSSEMEEEDKEHFLRGVTQSKTVILTSDFLVWDYLKNKILKD